MKYITLFGELLLFIPILVLVFFINPDNISSFGNLGFLVDFFSKILFFFSEKQIYIGLLLGIGLFFQELIGGAIKYFFFKPRPNPMKYTNWFEKVEAGSFPSLHSARTFILFLFSYFYTNIYVSIGFFIFWILVAYSRVVLKKHFYIDLCGGVILSSLVFFIIYNIF